VHSKYILSITTAFCLNYWTLEPYSAAILGAFWLHSCSIRTAFFNSDISARMWLKFWKLLIPAGSVSFLLSVTGALVIITVCLDYVTTCSSFLELGLDRHVYCGLRAVSAAPDPLTTSVLIWHSSIMMVARSEWVSEGGLHSSSPPTRWVVDNRWWDGMGWGRVRDGLSARWCVLTLPAERIISHDHSHSHVPSTVLYITLHWLVLPAYAVNFTGEYSYIDRRYTAHW